MCGRLIFGARELSAAALLERVLSARRARAQARAACRAACACSLALLGRQAGRQAVGLLVAGSRHGPAARAAPERRAASAGANTISRARRLLLIAEITRGQRSIEADDYEFAPTRSRPAARRIERRSAAI